MMLSCLHVCVLGGEHSAAREQGFPGTSGATPSQKMLKIREEMTYVLFKQNEIMLALI